MLDEEFLEEDRGGTESDQKNFANTTSTNNNNEGAKLKKKKDGR